MIHTHYDIDLEEVIDIFANLHPKKLEIKTLLAVDWNIVIKRPHRKHFLGRTCSLIESTKQCSVEVH